MDDMILLSTILATVGFIFIGFTFLTSQGNPAALGKAKGRLRNLILGFVFVLGAWLIVYTITNVLLKNPGAYSLIK